MLVRGFAHGTGTPRAQTVCYCMLCLAGHGPDTHHGNSLYFAMPSPHVHWSGTSHAHGHWHLATRAHYLYSPNMASVGLHATSEHSTETPAQCPEFADWSETGYTVTCRKEPKCGQGWETTDGWCMEECKRHTTRVNPLIHTGDGCGTWSDNEGTKGCGCTKEEIEVPLALAEECCTDVYMTDLATDKTYMFGGYVATPAATRYMYVHLKCFFISDRYPLPLRQYTPCRVHGERY